MKSQKYILLFVVLVFNICSSMELKAGINFSNQNISSTQYLNLDNRYLNGIIIGLSFNSLNFNDRSKVVADLLFTQRGMVERGINTDESGNFPSTYELKNKFSFLSGSILFKYLKPIQSHTFFFEIGPRIDHLLFKETMSGNYWEGFLYNDVVNREYGMDLSCGLKSGILSFEYRYCYNFTNSTTNEIFKINNFSHSIIIGIEIPKYED